MRPEAAALYCTRYRCLVSGDNIHMKKITFGLLLIFGALAHAGSLGVGSQTCPSSGVKQLSTTQTKATWVIVQAPSANAGSVYVGNISVSTSKGVYITSAQSLPLPAAANTQPYDLSQIYIACSNSNDTVTFLYLQ